MLNLTASLRWRSASSTWCGPEGCLLLCLLGMVEAGSGADIIDDICVGIVLWHR
jgi:hypothetical protein